MLQGWGSVSLAWRRKPEAAGARVSFSLTFATLLMQLVSGTRRLRSQQLASQHTCSSRLCLCVELSGPFVRSIRASASAPLSQSDVGAMPPPP